TNAFVTSGNHSGACGSVNAALTVSARVPMALLLVERIDEGETLTSMDRGYSMIGSRRDGKAHCAIVDWEENLVNIGRVRTIKKKQEPSVVILPAPIELNEKTVGFCTEDEIVMKTDPLAGYKFVSRDIHAVPQIYLEQLCHPLLDSRYKSVFAQK